MKQKFFTIAGWYGALAILGAYLLVSIGALKAGGWPYQVLNLTGAAGVLIISLQKRAYQPAFLNGAWVVIAVIALLRLL